MNSNGEKISFIFVFLMLFLLLSLSGLGDAEGYFNYPYTSSRFLSPMIGSSSYGTGLYGSMLSPFGFGGAYNLLSSLGYTYGAGLSGGLYGMSSLYGLGGLYGMSGLYGLGGLYGMSSLYGLGGLYGMSGLYGLYGLGGLYGMGGLYGLNSSTGFGLLSLLSGLGTNSLSPLSLNNPVVAEQAGTWQGTWNLGFLYGTMIMNLVENPITGTLSGTVQLIGNLTFAGLFNVYGTGTTTFVQVNGQDPTISYAITIQGTLTSATTMTGYYDIYKVGSAAPQETGTFNLNLLTAAVI